MQFIYKCAFLPNNKDLVVATNAAATRVHEKLHSMDVNEPKMDEYYRKRYFEVRLTQGSVSKLRNCSYHIMWAVANSNKPLDQISLIDHGGGLGLLSLLAKELGVGRVIYNDIDPKFLEAAQSIARLMGCEADDYLLGDIDRLIEQLGSNTIDAMVSYDVLEHIYDLDDFFAELCSSSCCPRVLFMSSGANMFSPFFLRSVIPIQRGRELLYSSKRIAIIEACAPHLREELIVMLCRKTRMLVRSEVEDVVKGYLQNEKVELPKKTGANTHDPYGTNTVDPETGWWAEHLVNPYYLARQLRKYGYTATIKPGYRGGRGSILNPAIKVLRGALALPLSGYYTVSAVKDDCHQ